MISTGTITLAIIAWLALLGFVLCLFAAGSRGECKSCGSTDHRDDECQRRWNP